jgi:DNA-binding CsgD family transcriptional regulator
MWSLWSEIFGFRQEALPWEYQELIQIFASLAMALGAVVGVGFVRATHRRLDKVNTQIKALAGQFHDHVAGQFDHWGLSKSEQAIATFTMKGFSNAENANLRGTSESTIKSQLNAIYRRTGLANRQQLTTFFVEELLDNFGAEASAGQRLFCRSRRIVSA